MISFFFSRFVVGMILKMELGPTAIIPEVIWKRNKGILEHHRGSNRFTPAQLAGAKSAASATPAVAPTVTPAAHGAVEPAADAAVDPAADAAVDPTANADVARAQAPCCKQKILSGQRSGQLSGHLSGHLSKELS